MPQIDKKGLGFRGGFVNRAGRRLVAAVALSAAVAACLQGKVGFAQDAGAAGAPAVVVKSSHDLAQDDLRGGLESIRKGDFLKGAELLDKAAANETQLNSLAKWADEFKGQRSTLIEERRKAYDEAVSDVQKLIAAKMEEAAIEYAQRAYVLAEDKTEFTKQPWVMALMESVAKKADDDVTQQEWVKAQRLYADLAAIEPFNKTWKEKLASVVRRTRMLTLYAPDRIKLLLEGDPKMVKEVNAILHPESTTQPSDEKENEATTKAFDKSLQIDWREELKGIRPEMFWYGLIDVRSYYWREPDFTKLMTEGLEGVKALATTNGLEDEFASLKDSQKKAAFVQQIDGLMTQMKAAPKGGELMIASQVYQGMQKVNTETVQLPPEVLIFEFSDAALATLDPFTQMLWPAQWEEFNKRTQGEFSGVGIQIQNDEEGNIKVISPIEDSPAFKAGIKAGDLIVAADGKSLKGITTTQAVRVITGPIGTPVMLTISNSDGTGAHDVRLVRDTIHVASLKGFMYKAGGGWDYFIDSDQKIAYLRLTEFTKSSGEELDKAAEELKKDGARGLIFDLRGNPGGLLTAAIDVANKFLSSGTIVSTRADRQTPQPPQSATARPDPDEVTIPLVVLVNQNSASASEIVSGALKDLGRAVIVGERSYGKGSVQMPFDVTGNRGTAFLKLTISHYYLPSGRCLHRDEDSTTWGVEPDVKVEMTPEQQLVAQLARMQFDVLRQTGEVAPAEPTTKPGMKGVTTRPVIRNADDLIARDSQLGAALLLMRLKLNGAEIEGTPHEAARAGS